MVSEGTHSHLPNVNVTFLVVCQGDFMHVKAGGYCGERTVAYHGSSRCCWLCFDHTISSDFASVRSAMDGMEQKKGFTNMAQVFALAETMYTSSGRKGAQSALLVITDGKPSFQFQQQLDDKGVQDQTNNLVQQLMTRVFSDQPS